MVLRTAGRRKDDSRPHLQDGNDRERLDFAYNRLHFHQTGTFLLRLGPTTGKVSQYKYFTLNVNSGYDEGVTILSNGKSGNGSLTFVKTLTSEESAAGEQEVFPDVFSSINPGQTLRNGKELFMSNATVKKVDYSGLLIATDDENGTMWHMEAKTFQLFKKVKYAFGRLTVQGVRRRAGFDIRIRGVHPR